MQDFDAIRPYRDEEVAGVIRRLAHDPALLKAAAVFFAPRLSRWAPWAARRLAGRAIERRTTGLDSINSVQLWLAEYMARFIRETVHELTVTGMEQVPEGRPHLFVSNHRDIVMDSALLNFRLHQAGHRTFRAAVGDNLLSESYAADLMRLNKSFVVERNVSGTKAMYQAMNRTSGYIRHSLEEGESVWIAQRGGRAKDGFDRTDPALLKMLSLAYRKELGSFAMLRDRISIIPVAVSYELDPCDLRKAHELYVLDTEGRYQKRPGEDVASMVDGITGYKARVHLHLAPPLAGDLADPDAMAAALDGIIVGGLRVFPTHVEAARRMGITCTDSDVPRLPRAMRAFEARLDACPEAERRFLLAGYGNLLKNRQALGLDAAEPCAVGAVSRPRT